MSTIVKPYFPESVQVKRKRVAAYTRVSSAKDTMLNSLSNQVHAYSSMIQANPEWEYAGVYIDEGITGTKEERPGFQQMMADCRAGKIDLILTKSISRFARNTLTLLSSIRELKILGIGVYFEEQNINSLSSDGELMLTILASFAQEESRSMSENMKWRIRKNFQEGKPWCGTLFGYVMKNGKYEIVPEEAAIVKRIFREYLEGNGTNKIIRGLIDDNIPTRKNKEWHETCIVKMLKHYAYTGNLLLQRTYRKDHITKESCINNGELPMYHVEEAHDAIIDIDTYNAVQLEMARRSEMANRSKEAQKKYPFTGIIFCANCGKTYRRKVTATQPVWICYTFNSLGKKYCPSKQVPESVLEEITETVAPLDEISKILVKENNTLEYYLADGRIVTRVWRDRSRSESWTPEKREAARIQKQERDRKNAKNHVHTSNN